MTPPPRPPAVATAGPPGPPRRSYPHSGSSRVDDAEQVLQPELPAVLGVIPGALDVEEQVPVGRFRQREQPRLATRPPSAPRSGSRISYWILPSSLLAPSSRACRWALRRTPGLTRSSRARSASAAHPRRVEIP